MRDVLRCKCEERIELGRKGKALVSGEVRSRLSGPPSPSSPPAAASPAVAVLLRSIGLDILIEVLAASGYWIFIY